MHGGLRPDSALAQSNMLLGALDPEDLALIAPYLVRRDVEGGQRLVVPHQPLDRVIFPETAVVSLGAPVGNGQLLDIGLIGREGLVGWSALIGEDRPGHGSTVLLQGGSALTIAAARLRAACAASETLLTSLMRFVDVFVGQLGQTIVATARDTAEQRLARWILMLHDRIDGDELVIKHSELGSLLNVRRATITDCLHVLEGERALRCRRGRIVLRDRAVLEARAGASYGGIDSRYRQSMGGVDKRGPIPPPALTLN